jgi:predicted DNA-binding antitoxin AbrB/MazE fold protein
MNDEEGIMAITVEAVYEGGVLRPVRPLPLREGETIEVVIPSLEDNPVTRSHGLIAWNRDWNELEEFLNDPDHSFGGSPEDWPERRGRP